jgi:TatD DNase family protein
VYVDSHCHLSFPALRDQLPQIREAMRVAKVVQALVICTTLEEFETVHSLALNDAELWASVGVHPDNEGVQEPDAATLIELANRPRVVALGETGLDYFRLGERTLADMHWQRERLRVHVQAARAVKKPLIIHTRNASADTLRILQEEGAREVGGVFHCFTETAEVARAALDLGFHISFSGIITFRNAEALRDVAREVPLDRCLIETDSPYLAPAPYRGKTNSPAYVPWVAAELARVKGLDVEAVAEATSANFRRLFRIPAPLNPA